MDDATKKITQCSAEGVRHGNAIGSLRAELLLLAWRPAVRAASKSRTAEQSGILLAGAHTWVWQDMRWSGRHAADSRPMRPMNAPVFHIEYASFSGWLYFTLPLQSASSILAVSRNAHAGPGTCRGKPTSFGLSHWRPVFPACRIAPALDPILQPASQSALTQIAMPASEDPEII